MIQIKPSIDVIVRCPKCGSDCMPGNESVCIPGMFVYICGCCPACGYEFYQALPVGHNVSAPMTIGRDGKLFSVNPDFDWLSSLAVNSVTMDEAPVKIERAVLRQTNRIVLLNTLDFLYGHVLLKLLNLHHHLNADDEYGVVVLAPQSFEWLIPSGIAEKWIVHLKVSDFRRSHAAIARFVANELKRFDEVKISSAYSHPETSLIDISAFTLVRPFDLDRFDKTIPCITFILRDDRWWFANRFWYYGYRLLRRLRLLDRLGAILSGQQERLVRKTVDEIHRHLGTVRFYIAGVGMKRRQYREVVDLRQAKVTDSIEREWCRVYSESHVVIGVHGSNMLLPTAHAAGCVEILPEDRYGNMIQDVFVRCGDRRQLFLYRMADQYASPRSVAAKAVSIIRHYKAFHRNMVDQVYENRDRDRAQTVTPVMDEASFGNDIV